MTPIVDIEKDRILKCIRAAESQLELRGSSERTRKLIDKLVETFLINLVRTFRFVANKSEFLQRNVEKMIRVRTGTRKRRERPPHLIERRLKRGGRNPHDANRVDALASTPLSRVVASIGDRVKRAERLPYAAIGGILPPGCLKITPTLAEQLNASRKCGSGCPGHPESGAKARSL
jgi:hypothetical protein